MATAMTARAPAAARPGSGASAAAVEHRNEVFLVGRMTSAALARQLPSGDVLTSWRIVVDRPDNQRRAERRGHQLDVVDCVAWLAKVRRLTGSWEVGDVLEIRGSIRRRFWRTPTGALNSRTEVEVTAAGRLATADGQLTRRRTPG